MIVFLEVWEVIDNIVEEKGEVELGNLSWYGMSCAFEKYLEGTYSNNFHNFYERNKDRFTSVRRREDLKNMYDRFSLGLNN